MSSNILIDRTCDYCKKTFKAKTTVTRFCSKTCNSRFYKLRLKSLKIDASQRESEMKLAEVSTSPAHAVNKEYLSIEEACNLIGISRMTLHRLLKAGKIRHKKIGRRTIITKGAIDQFINNPY